MSIITIKELERRIARFQKILPTNCATNKKWTHMDICRVICKHVVTREFNPSVPHDKIDLVHLLRRQYYTDIELSARLKIVKLKEQTAQLRLIS